MNLRIIKNKITGRTISCILFITAIILFSGCIEDSVNKVSLFSTSTATEIATSTPEITPTPIPTITPVINPNETVIPISDNTIKIAAFNIQVFGTTKASKPDVMDTLAKIVRTYDVVAVQEIRDQSQTSFPLLITYVNENNSQYDFVVSERLGRTSSMEQYAYIYNTQTIELTGTPHTYPEPTGTDPFHRQPYITSFRTPNGNFDAVLITIHTYPDEATEEINTLDDVVEYAQREYPDEQDFIVMGDLNADGSYFNENSASDMSSTEYVWIIDNSQDTTTKSTNYTYDRIILTDTSDYAGDSGVFRFDTEYGLNYDETVAVSDHYPVYAVFWIDRDDDNSSASTNESNQTISSTVQITDLSLDEEWVKIMNTGTSSISLTGWELKDEGDKYTYTFPLFSLESGSTVTVHTEKGMNTATELYWGSGRPIWNNDGDNARLYDINGNLVDQREG
jgi:deoxyribonuclease-1-like protein